MIFTSFSETQPNRCTERGDYLSAGSLGFVFTSQHADTEIGLDTGEFTRYDAEYAPALDCVFLDKNQ